MSDFLARGGALPGFRALARSKSCASAMNLSDFCPKLERLLSRSRSSLGVVELERGIPAMGKALTWGNVRLEKPDTSGAHVKSQTRASSGKIAFPVRVVRAIGLRRVQCGRTTSKRAFKPRIRASAPRAPVYRGSKTQSNALRQVAKIRLACLAVRSSAMAELAAGL